MPTDPTDFTSRGSGPPRSAGTTPTPGFRSDATAAPLLSGMAENLFWKWRGFRAHGCWQLARQGQRLRALRWLTALLDATLRGRGDALPAPGFRGLQAIRS